MSFGMLLLLPWLLPGCSSEEEKICAKARDAAKGSPAADHLDDCEKLMAKELGRCDNRSEVASCYLDASNPLQASCAAKCELSDDAREQRAASSKCDEQHQRCRKLCGPGKPACVGECHDAMVACLDKAD